jgi:hypothetical protein
MITEIESNTMSQKRDLKRNDKERKFYQDDYVFWNQIDSSFNRLKRPEKQNYFECSYF